MLTLAVIVIGLVLGTSLSPEAIAALVTAAGGFIAAVTAAGFAWKNRKRDDEGQAVQAATGIFDAYKGLVEDLQRTVARLIEERDRALAALALARVELADSPERIHELEETQHALEAQLAASVAQLTALGQEAQDVADEIKDVADEAEEAANGG